MTKMEATKKALRLTNKEDKSKETLDANLWGKLQEYIPLQLIYEKLLQQDLSQLRLVSKEWNHSALQRVLPKPYFVFITPRTIGSWKVQTTGSWKVRLLNGFFTYNNSVFDRPCLCLSNIKSQVPPLEVEGLILCYNPNDLEQRGVFNVHTQTWHAIPPGPKQRKSACGMLVDTTVKPYTFKLIEGNFRFGTQVYDSKSRSLSRTSSWLQPSYPLTTLEYSCICHNNNVYISVGIYRILKYSLEDDKWTMFGSPKAKYPLNNRPLGNTLGVWAGRIFTTRREDTKQRFTLWELVDSEGREWVEYAHLSKEQYKWLLKREIGDNFPVGLRSLFRDGYLLICSWRWDSACANELVLFDMATKIWRKVDLSRGTISGN